MTNRTNDEKDDETDEPGGPEVDFAAVPFSIPRSKEVCDVRSVADS